MTIENSELTTEGRTEGRYFGSGSTVPRAHLEGVDPLVALLQQRHSHRPPGRSVVGAEEKVEVVAVGDEPSVAGLLLAHGLGHHQHPLPPADGKFGVVLVAGPAHAARGSLKKLRIKLRCHEEERSVDVPPEFGKCAAQPRQLRRIDLVLLLLQAGLVILPAPKVLLRLFLQGKNTVYQQSLLRLNDEIIVGSFSDSSFLPSVT